MCSRFLTQNSINFGLKPKTKNVNWWGKVRVITGRVGFYFKLDPAWLCACPGFRPDLCIFLFLPHNPARTNSTQFNQILKNANLSDLWTKPDFFFSGWFGLTQHMITPTKQKKTYMSVKAKKKKVFEKWIPTWFLSSVSISVEVSSVCWLLSAMPEESAQFSTWPFPKGKFSIAIPFWYISEHPTPPVVEPISPDP